MNQIDYKEIAKIMNQLRLDVFDDCKVKKAINKLADYFEKENKHHKLINNKWQEPFNREQFLKDCGMKK